MGSVGDFYRWDSSAALKQDCNYSDAQTSAFILTSIKLYFQINTLDLQKSERQKERGCGTRVANMVMMFK